MDPKKPPLKAFDVHTSQVLRDEYGMNAANRPVIVVVGSGIAASDQRVESCSPTTALVATGKHPIFTAY